SDLTKSMHLLAQIIAADYFALRREPRLFAGHFLDGDFILAGLHQQRVKPGPHRGLRMAPFAFQLLQLVGAKTVARGTPKPRRNSPESAAGKSHVGGTRVTITAPSSTSNEN